MALTINTRTYSQDRVNADQVSYTGVGNTLSVKDTFTLQRVYPKPTSTFKGVARPQVKRTRTVVVNSTTGETADMLLTISGSIPVGTPDADITLALADAASFLATSDASSLFKNLDVLA